MSYTTDCHMCAALRDVERNSTVISVRDIKVHKRKTNCIREGELDLPHGKTLHETPMGRVRKIVVEKGRQTCAGSPESDHSGT